MTASIRQSDDSTLFRYIAFALAIISIYILFRPYLQPVLASLLVFYILRPLYNRLVPYVGERLAAIISVMGFAVLIFIPLLVLGSALLEGIRVILELLREGVLISNGSRTTFGELYSGDFTIEQLLSNSDRRVELSAVIRDAAGLLGGFTEAFLWVTVLVFVLYYLLVDGTELYRWIDQRIPRPDNERERLWTYTDDLVFAAIVGDISVAVIQGVLLGIAFFFLGLPGVLFWTLLTTILALLPIVGSFVVYIPTAVYFFAAGRPVAGGLLLVYGIVIVSLSDDYLRPLIGAKTAKLNPALVIVGIFGGLAIFGFLGVFYGPILIGLSKGVFEIVGSNKPMETDR